MRCEGCNREFAFGERVYEAACQYYFCKSCVEVHWAIPVPA